MPEELLYSRISQMEPMLPDSGKSSELINPAIEVMRRASALSTRLHPVTRRGIVDLVRAMNSYYSNLIEGHHTHPADIERALARDFSTDPAKRALQVESAAHVEVQRLIEQRLEGDPDQDIWGADFLCWIHREFYERLPPEFLVIKTAEGEKRVEPGQLRENEVTVGHHLAPAASSLKNFLARFKEAYGGKSLKPTDSIIAVAASHHRLAWIHPFFDGNGRVTRLFTHASLIKTRIDGHGLWTVTRGLARNREAYLTALAGADAHRQGDYDGRGSLSEKGLELFCSFFLRMALDQIEYMTALLELDGMLKRIEGYVTRQVHLGELQAESFFLLREAFLRGEIPRGEAARITGKPERSARRVLKDLLNKSLLVSDSEKGPVRLAFPTKVAAYYFPLLYPEGIEAGMI
ncbi:MAG: Fic family protein [Proteobacteria bacterium]|nr:Fic family protein [Pseudomonadota bacterium]MBU1739282.1 Fic family protein [Pseudomonadota bacterium]